MLDRTPGVTKFLPLLGETVVKPGIDLGLGTVFCFAVNGENIFYRNHAGACKRYARLYDHSRRFLVGHRQYRQELAGISRLAARPSQMAANDLAKNRPGRQQSCAR
jgi:hypothetical protein